MLRLAIKLLSPMCPSSGMGRPGIVDRDVVFEPEGLPYVPGRRLKGLLRDAYRELREAPGFVFPGLPSPEEVFGRTGDYKAGRLRLENAWLSDRPVLASWLRWLARESTPITREDVMAEHTSIRRQTKIDRHYARAEEDTLRATRLLRAGLEFHAAIGDLTEADCTALALAAAALQSMGTARNRGLGEVECRLQKDDGDKWIDLTAEALAGLEEEKLVSAGVSKGAAAHLATEQGDSAVSTLPSRLVFSIKLQQGAVLPKIGGDPFTVATHDYIPGSSIRGLLASLYLNAHGLADDRFYKLFCGDVAFLPATPTLPSGRTSQPVPHSVRTDKHDPKKIEDLALKPERDPEEGPLPSARVQFRWANLASLQNGSEAEHVAVQTELHYHHARAGDRRVQRALGTFDPDKPDDFTELDDSTRRLDNAHRGALFNYESIAPGQTFMGEILGPPRDLDQIRSLISDDGARVNIGRSRNAQYGGAATFFWTSKPEARGSSEETVEAERLIVTLLTPLIGVNKYGHPVPEFPTAELAEALGTELKDERAFTRTEWQGAYLAHQRLPRQQMPALSAGSVFILRVKDPNGRKLMLGDAARRSYGLRTEDGFGRIDIRVHEETEYAAVHFAREGPIRFAETDKSVEAADGPRRSLAMGILKERIQLHARGEALKDAHKAYNDLDRVNPHLIARLSLMLAQSTLDEFAAKLKDPEDVPPRERARTLLRDTARRQLDRVWIKLPDKNHTLRSYLRDRAANWGAAFDALAKAVYSGTPSWFEVLGTDNPLSGSKTHADFAKKVMHGYLAQYLAGLAIEIRRREKGRRHAAGGKA